MSGHREAGVRVLLHTVGPEAAQPYLLLSGVGWAETGSCAPPQAAGNFGGMEQVAQGEMGQG